MIDKLRAAQPGGELNGYFAFQGLSELWQHYSGVNLRELYDVVARANDESAVERWLDERTESLDKSSINAKMEAFNSARIRDDWKPTFETVYPPELRERHAVLFDLLEADDQRLFSPQ